jgi:hypothetical protein
VGLLSRHGGSMFSLVSLAQYTGISRVLLAAPPYYQLALDLFTPENIIA